MHFFDSVTRFTNCSHPCATITCQHYCQYRPLDSTEKNHTYVAGKCITQTLSQLVEQYNPLWGLYR